MLAAETQAAGQQTDRLLVSLQEAARLWGVAYWTTVGWAKQGRIRTIKLSRRRMVPMSEVKRVAEEGI